MSKQKGNVFLIVLVLVVFVVGAWQYGEFQSRKRLDDVQQAEAEKARAERAELERRQAKAKEEHDSMKVALKAVDDLVTRWDDANRVASATSRIALSGPVSTLQSIRREADGLTVPPCLDAGMTALRKSMDTTLEAYITFMSAGGVGSVRVCRILCNRTIHCRRKPACP